MTRVRGVESPANSPPVTQHLGTCNSPICRMSLSTMLARLLYKYRRINTGPFSQGRVGLARHYILLASVYRLFWTCWGKCWMLPDISFVFNFHYSVLSSFWMEITVPLVYISVALQVVDRQLTWKCIWGVSRENSP